MKQFFQKLSCWWFATMTPAYAPLTTISERETMRKRRLLSIILLISFSGAVLLLLMSLLTKADVLQVWNDLVGIGCLSLPLWINWRGYLKLASLCYLLTAFVGLAVTVIILSLNSPIFFFGLWPFLLVLPVAAGLFLPAWGPLLLGILTDAFLCWFVLYERQSQIAFYLRVPDDRITFLTISCIITSVVTGFSAISAYVTQKAIIQADRTVEVEQAYTSLEAAHATIQKQALTDGLTGLPNHRAIMEQFTKEIERARRYGRPFSLLFFDADRFKRVNDTHGHAAGDAVLRQIGERASSVLRGGDTIGRFGGEEFMILLPEADAEEARSIAERIRATVAAGPMGTTEVEGGLAATISIGLSVYPFDGESEQAVLSQADEAMYIAKRLGRNQVRTAEEARQMGADASLMALLQEEEQHEATQREGITSEQLRENYTMRMINSLLSLLERRDVGLSTHALVVSDLATAIAQRRGRDLFEVSRIGMAALLHDIGKVAIPDALLQKVGSLTYDEHALLQEHAELGAEILGGSPFLDDLIPAVRHHHERWDGNGFPDQLAKEDIPLAARIIAVAEAYDFMQRTLPYHVSYSPEKALAEMERCAGTQFDPAIVQTLIEVLSDQQAHHQTLPRVQITLTP